MLLQNSEPAASRCRGLFSAAAAAARAAACTAAPPLPPKRSEKISRKLEPPPDPAVARVQIKSRKIKSRAPLRRPLDAPAPNGESAIEIVGVISKAVEDLAFLLVRKNVVGFLHLFEFVLGRLVVRIYVRMKLARHAAVRLLDLVRLCVLFDAENFVIILLCHLFIKTECEFYSFENFDHSFVEICVT